MRSVMLRRLIEEFPGTCRKCFDTSDSYAPIHREGGQI